MKLSSQQYAIGLGAIFLMGLLFGILYHYTAGRVGASASFRLNMLAQHNADMVQDWLSCHVRTLKVASAFVQKGRDNDKSLAGVAGLAVLSSLDTCLVLQLDGQPLSLYTKGRRDALGQGAKEAGRWVTLLARATDEGRIEAPVPCPAGTGPSVSAALPLHEENGRRFGVIALSIPLPSLAKAMLAARTMLSDDRLFFLTNEKGIILVSSQRGDREVSDVTEHPDLRTLPLMLRAFNDGPIYHTIEGKEFMAAGAEVGGTGGWRFYLLSPRSSELDLLPAVSFALAGAWICLSFFVLLVLYQLRKHAHYKVLSERDHLTGAGNRLAFELALSRLEKSREFPACLIVMDVDGLKRYNDLLGHETGDTLLRRVMLVLQRSLRENDDIFRIGGDEFAVVIPGASYSMAEPLIARINVQAALMREAAEQPPVYISCGIAEARDEASLSTLFIRADEAMYINKNSRRDMVSREIMKWIEEHPDFEERRAPQ